MNYVNFFGKQVSKLIIGDNPFNGHSYIADKTPGSEMKEFYTAEKIKETLWEIEKSGINTMLPLADPFIIRLLQEYQREGGKMQFIFQPYMPMRQQVSMREMMKLNTIGIYHQGTTTDYLFESNQTEQIVAQIEEYHSMGIPVGLGTHRPDVIELSEREGWPVDFYVACLQNARRNREGEQSGFITGKSKQGLVFAPEDRPIMINTVNKISKPILAFKIFAGGQMFLNKSDDERRQIIKGVYEEVFTGLKPNDFAAVGIFQRDRNELEENVALYNEWYAEKPRLF